MPDSDRLREALDEAGCWMAEDWGDQHNSADCDACTIDAAARRFLALTETGQRVLWCEYHKAQIREPSVRKLCGVGWSYLRSDDPDEAAHCSAVPVYLTLADYLTEEET